MRLSLVVMLCGCAGAPTAPRTSSDGCAGHDDRPRGASTDYVAPTLPGFTIAAPLLCEREHGAYIRVERTAGTRELGTGRAPDGGFREGCVRAPTADDACPVLDWSVPMLASGRALQARGHVLNGIGGGPCADLQGDFAAWNMSMGVTSWHEAALAVELLANELNRYDVRGYLGVAVRGIPCAVAE